MRRAGGWITAVGLLAVVGTAPVALADYPPATYGEGAVDRSVVHPGECVHFSGGGYAAGAALTVTDNSQPATAGTAGSDGRYRLPVCFNSDATLGRHELAAHGQGANTAPRTVTAAVRVEGVTQSGEASTVGGTSQGGTVGSGSGGSGHGGGSSGGASSGGTPGGGGSSGGASSGGSSAGNAPTNAGSSAAGSHGSGPAVGSSTQGGQAGAQPQTSAHGIAVARLVAIALVLALLVTGALLALRARRRVHG